MPEMQDVKKLVQEIVERATGKEQIEVVASRAVETDIMVYEANVESLTRAESIGIGIRVINNGRMGFAHCGTSDYDSVIEALEAARDNSRFATEDQFAALVAPDGVDAAALDLIDPEFHKPTLEEKIALAMELEALITRGDPRVAKVESSNYSEAEAEGFVASSEGIFAHTRETFAYISGHAIAEQDGDTRTGGGYSVSRGLSGIDVNKAANDVVSRCTELLGAKKPASTRATVIFDPRITATLLSIVGGSLSADAAQKGRSMFSGRIGEQIASPAFQLLDDPTEPRAQGASLFDGEGLACRRNSLIENGVLMTFLYDSYTARKEGRASTASAVRGYSSTPSPGPMALQLAPGKLDQEELIKLVQNGILIRSISGVHSGVNPISGDFSVGAEGIIIQDGERKHAFKEATIASTIQRMLMGVVAIGSDVEWLPGISAGPSIAIENMSLSGI